jgi:hypothetical protein
LTCHISPKTDQRDDCCHWTPTIHFDFRKIGNIFIGSLVRRIGCFNSLLEATAAFTLIWLDVVLDVPHEVVCESAILAKR